MNQHNTKEAQTCERPEPLPCMRRIKEITPRTRTHPKRMANACMLNPADLPPSVLSLNAAEKLHWLHLQGICSTKGMQLLGDCLPSTSCLQGTSSDCMGCGNNTLSSECPQENAKQLPRTR